MSEQRCPQCNYGPVRADAITCVRCGRVFPRAADPVVDLPCERCGKKYALKKSIAVERVMAKKARCQTCGGPLLLPKDVVEAAAAPRIEVATPAPCLCCERLARPDAVLRDQLVCGFCGMRFRVGQDTTAHVDGAHDIDAATATARVSTSGMPDTAIAGIVKVALVARARRELEAGPDTAGGARIAAYAGINAIGLAALAATGSGFIVVPGSGRSADVNHPVMRTRV